MICTAVCTIGMNDLSDESDTLLLLIAMKSIHRVTTRLRVMIYMSYLHMSAQVVYGDAKIIHVWPVFVLVLHR